MTCDWDCYYTLHVFFETVIYIFLLTAKQGFDCLFVCLFVCLFLFLFVFFFFRKNTEWIDKYLTAPSEAHRINETLDVCLFVCLFVLCFLPRLVENLLILSCLVLSKSKNILHVDVFFGDLKVEQISEQPSYELFQFVCKYLESPLKFSKRILMLVSD